MDLSRYEVKNMDNKNSEKIARAVRKIIQLALKADQLERKSTLNKNEPRWRLHPGVGFLN